VTIGQDIVGSLLEIQDTADHDKGENKMSLQIIGLNEAAKRMGVHRRSLERLIEQGIGPAVIQLTPRRRGITEPTFENWIKGKEMRIAPRRTRRPMAKEAA
jgi:predicted DNA-binding transcriptional regulator AlpA